MCCARTCASARHATAHHHRRTPPPTATACRSPWPPPPAPPHAGPSFPFPAPRRRSQPTRRPVLQLPRRQQRPQARAAPLARRGCCHLLPRACGRASRPAAPSTRLNRDRARTWRTCAARKSCDSVVGLTTKQIMMRGRTVRKLLCDYKALSQGGRTGEGSAHVHVRATLAERTCTCCSTSYRHGGKHLATT